MKPEKGSDIQALAKLIKGRGFSLLPPPHPGSPGYSGLLVAIRKQPTGERFDPERLILPLRDNGGVDWWRKLSLLSPPPEMAQHQEEILLELGYSWDEIVEINDHNQEVLMKKIQELGIELPS